MLNLRRNTNALLGGDLDMATRIAEVRKSVLALPRRDRLELLADLWDSIGPVEAEVTDNERNFARRELAEYRKNPGKVVAWAEAIKQIGGKP